MPKRDKEMKVAAPVAAPVEEMVDFESWYSERHHRIPAHHHKEILKADFMGQGVTRGTMRDFDKALEKYGVKLG